jgi:hypothetical protein
MKYRLGFVIIIEHGELESKTTLLVESIRRLPVLQDCPIYVVQPRPGALPSRATFDILDQQDVRYVYANLNRTWRHHAFMNKIYASAWIESFVENTLETLVYLDADVILTRAPEGLALTGEEVVAVAPIAEWQAGKVGQLVEKPLTPYWKLIYDICGVKELPEWEVTTIIDGLRIFPYFNSGVVAVQPAQGIFRLWQESMERLAQDERVHQFAANTREFFFLDQASLAGTLLARFSREQIRVLNHRYNYPLPAHHLLPDGVRGSALDDISIVHYHTLFSNLYWMDDMVISEPLKAWLLERLPLRPQLRLRRSNALQLTTHLLSRFPFRQHHRRVLSRLPGLRNTLPHPECNP